MSLNNICCKIIKSRNLLKIRLASSLTTVNIDDKTGYAELTMNRPPVNGLNLELLRDIGESIKEIERNKCRGLILTSSSSTVFSAGLDLMEMYKPDQERLKNFWTTLQGTWLKLYGSNVPTVAFINGHSPAGGCLLATSCEYRVMLPNYTIGLNETLLGIVAPKWFMDTFLNVLPRRTAEMALTQGKLFTTDEAYKIGLVDVVVNSKEEGFQKCHEFLNSYAKVNPFARAMTKQQFRAKDLQQLEKDRESDLQSFIYFVNQDSVQQGLAKYFESLKKKKN